MTEEQDRFRVVRSNERFRTFASMAANLATALIAATAYRLVVEGRQDVTAALWMIGTVTLMSVASGLLGLVEPEG